MPNIITFRDNVPIKDTMCFEEVYEPELQMNLSEKLDLLQGEYAKLWLYVDGNIAGEIYGIQPHTLYESGITVEDCEPYRDFETLSMYCYSTTILPHYQEAGLVKILVAAWNNYCKSAGFTTIVGHATSPKMKSVREFFGAVFDPTGVHENWYDTERTAHFYVQPL